MSYITRPYQKAIREATVVVAASDSKDKTRADYVCTGSNDQNTINEAIDSLPSGGGGVLLLDGQYNLSSYISIMKNYVSLFGQGFGTLLYLENGANTSVIRVGDESTTLKGIYIGHLQINGNKANQSTATECDGIYFYGGSSNYITDSLIEWVYTHDNYFSGIGLWYTRYVTVANIISDSNDHNGIEINYGEKNMVLSSLLSNNVTVGHGILIVGSNYNRIIANHTTGNTVAGMGFDTNADNNLIVGNIIEESTPIKWWSPGDNNYFVANEFLNDPDMSYGLFRSIKVGTVVEDLLEEI